MAKHTIKLKKYVDIINEYVAAAIVTPGYLLELTSAGKVQHHSSAGGNAPKYIALEDELQGRAITDNYAAADPVQVWMAVPGEEAYMMLADGETTVIGSLLESAGDGTLQVHVADVDSSADITFIYPLQIVAQALEVVDMSDSSTADPSGRVKVRFV